MISKLFEKIKNSYPDTFDSIKEIIESKNYHLILDLNLKDDVKLNILRRLLSEKYTNIFKTRKARELQVQIINKIKNYISTPYAKELVLKLFPTLDAKEILKRQEFAQLAKDCFSSVQNNIDLIKTLISDISKITYTSSKRHNGVALVFADEHLYDDMKSILTKKFYVTLVDSEHDLLSIDHYEQIRFIPGKNDSLTQFVEQLPQATILLGSPSPEDIAPELITDIIEENRSFIDSLYTLNAYLPINNLPSKITSNSIEKVSFSQVESQIVSLAKELETVIQEQISKAAFSGDTLIQVISEKSSILDLLDVASQEVIRTKKQHMLAQSSDILGASTSALFNVDYVGHVTLDESQLDLIKTQFQTSQDQLLTKKRQNLASLAKVLVSLLPTIVEEVYNLDLKLAVGNFISFYNLEKPTLVDKGISFVYGRNMNISNAVPVEYYVGSTSLNNSQKTEDITVLTGANSGGKTTLLELLAQVQLLTQMGLFVPAKEAKVGMIEELYYFSKNKGSLSAGAFETLLKQFADISDSDSPRLILADEIESVTEPSVAAKIIEGIITHISSQKNTLLILVTHMGAELGLQKLPCRFDGIEAKGLDDSLNLVVDRNPVIGRIARSTPQLIVERLARKEDNIFYSHLYETIIAE